MLIHFYWAGSGADDPFAVRDWPNPPAIGVQVRLRVPKGDTRFQSVEGHVVEVQIADTCMGTGAALISQPCSAVTLKRIGVIS